VFGSAVFVDGLLVLVEPVVAVVVSVGDVLVLVLAVVPLVPVVPEVAAAPPACSIFALVSVNVPSALRSTHPVNAMLRAD
jgi:hypothetical protein